MPISRMYMRTGSVVRPNSLSMVASAAAASSVSSSSALTVDPHEQERVGIGRHFVYGNAHVVDHRNDVFDLLRVDDAFGQVVVDLRIREVSLLLSLCNQ